MATITVKIEGHDPETVTDVGQFIVLTIPTDTTKVEETQLMCLATPKAMAEMALFLLRLAKKRMKNEDIRDVKLGDMSVDPDALKHRIALPPNMRRGNGKIVGSIH